MAYYFCILQQNSILHHYTQYWPSDLCACVKDLHRLCCSSDTSNLPAIREKYSQHKVICQNTNTCYAMFSLLVRLLTLICGSTNMWPRNASLFQYRKKFSRIEQRNLCGQSNYDTGQVLSKIQSKRLKDHFLLNLEDISRHMTQVKRVI